MNTHAIVMVAVIALVTVALRAVPFLLFGKSREIPAWVQYFSRVLPFAVMGMLVVYCLRGITPLTAPHGIPECIACAVVIGLHCWKRNTLLSIVGGTACYMVLVQLVF